MECERFLILHLGYSLGYAIALTKITVLAAWIGKILLMISLLPAKICVNGLSTIFGLASSILKGLYNGINPYLNYRLPSWAKELVTILQLPPTNDCQLNVDRLFGVAESFTAANCTASFPNGVNNGLSSLYVLVFNFTTIHAMTHRFDFCLAWSSSVNIDDPAVYFTIR